VEHSEFPARSGQTIVVYVSPDTGVEVLGRQGSGYETTASIAVVYGTA
jgi:hypothetical protein